MVQSSRNFLKHSFFETVLKLVLWEHQLSKFVVILIRKKE